MVSGGDVAANLDAGGAADRRRRPRQGARLVVLPEYFGIFGARATDKLAVREAATATARSRRSSRGMRASTASGSSAARVPLACDDPDARAQRVPRLRSRTARASRATTRSISSRSRAATSATTKAGRSSPARRRSAFELPCGRVGLSICYDLRFPELYRGFGDLALILVPSAFTATTGAAHWHLLLRARAVENQCYVLAAAQGGMHPERPAHLRPLAADRPVGRDRRRARGRSRHRRRRRRSGAHRRSARSSCRRSPIACSSCSAR